MINRVMGKTRKEMVAHHPNLKKNIFKILTEKHGDTVYLNEGCGHVEFTAAHIPLNHT